MRAALCESGSKSRGIAIIPHKTIHPFRISHILLFDRNTDWRLPCISVSSDIGFSRGAKEKLWQPSGYRKTRDKRYCRPNRVKLMFSDHANQNAKKRRIGCLLGSFMPPRSFGDDVKGCQKENEACILQSKPENTSFLTCVLPLYAKILREVTINEQFLHF